MSAIVKVAFHGDDLDTVKTGDDAWVSVRRVCDALQISHEPQLAKLKSKPWATMTMIVTVAEDGRNREQAFVHLDSLPMWLATIEPSKVAPAARAKLVDYQRECARVLRDHFFGTKPAAPPSVPVANITDLFTQVIAALAGFDRRLGTLEMQDPTVRYTVGEPGRRAILAKLMELARLTATDRRTILRVRSALDMELRAFANFNGKGRRWSELSAHDYHRVSLRLGEMLATARIAHEGRAQLSLVPTGTGGE